MTVDAHTEKYSAHMHAVQSGIATLISLDPGYASKKDLRVGIDSAHVSDAAVAALLIRKGIFTEEEYMEELALQAENEQERYEKDLSKRYGAEIKLA